MKNHTTQFLIVAIALAVGCFSFICRSKKYTINGEVVRYGTYCGGAAPPPGLLDELRQAKPIAGQKLFVRKGLINDAKNKIIDSVNTDSAGHFKLSLPVGTYVLITRDQIAAFHFDSKTLDQFSKVNEDCLRDRYQKGVYQLTVDARSKKNILVEFFDHCPWQQPCVTYTGPLPPSAPPHRSGE